MAGSSGNERAADLLLRALSSLEPAERDIVLKAVLCGSLPTHPVQPLALGDFPSVPAGPGSWVATTGQSQMNQPLVIRLPSDLHARFRKWSTNNGFSMAAVARGLIERFLDERT